MGGKINSKQTWNMPQTNGIFQTANSLKAAPKNAANPRPKRKVKPRRKSKVNNAVKNATHSDSESPEAKSTNGHKRKSSTPFKEIDSKMASRRRSRSNLDNANEALYDISTKNVQRIRNNKSGDFDGFNVKSLDEGNEDGSGDSDTDTESKQKLARADRTKTKAYKRKKRKDKERKRSVGTVLKEKMINMTR